MLHRILLPIYVAPILLSTLISSEVRSQSRNSDARPTSDADQALGQLNGAWLFVEDRTEGVPDVMGGPPMSGRFSLRVEADAIVFPRPQGDERIPLDGSMVEDRPNQESIKRYRGRWKEGAFEYTQETYHAADNHRVLLIRRVLRPTDEGLLVQVFLNNETKREALYRHPSDISLPDPAKATIDDLAWMAHSWIRKTSDASVEERWSPPRGGAMLAIARTVKAEKMVAFEYLRIIEREGGLVYIAQPAGRAPTEFVLTQLEERRATFVNPRHDYPQKIVYELSSHGALTTSIGYANGRLQGIEFHREKD